jgi:hypothetical protein
VRKVCNICNNGWMSEMEKRTEPAPEICTGH